MTKIVPGMLVVMKTTDEPCFVLSVAKVQGSVLSGETVTVRRPVISQNGLAYTTETFHVEELDTKEDRRSRQIKEMQGDALAIGLPTTKH